MAHTPSSDDIRKSLTSLFAGYRAEWLSEQVFSLFSQPSYFPQLIAGHPCFLVGGRGSGKTTVLRCLSYEGQFEMCGKDPALAAKWEFVGLYYRVNTNRVAAFSGPEVDEAKWIRLFAHYLNLELCERVFAFLKWRSVRFPDEPHLTAQDLESFAASMFLEKSAGQTEMARILEVSRHRFEVLVNSIGDTDRLPQLSMQGAPVDALLRAVRALPQFRGLQFFFLLDEYENFSDVQQRVCNTLIKHCGELYSFKVGVRELGLRQRTTLNVHEQLTHPADYKRIDIQDELSGRFEEFAEQVCLQRLRHALPDPPKAMKDILPSLSPEAEAAELGVATKADAIRREVDQNLDTHSAVREWVNGLSDLEVFALECRAKAEQLATLEKCVEAFNNQKAWHSHFQNYKVPYLYAIRTRKRGIRKHYAGWKTYCAMAGNNIRFLLELVDQALSRHQDEGLAVSVPISAKLQTLAAQFTGQKNLRELEGTIHGAKLVRVLLGLGRVFQVMAADPIGHTPEVNQFALSSGPGECSGSEAEEVEELLTQGVMHLALLRYKGSKLREESDIKQYDFAIHPIYSAFFAFSHRRKREIPLSTRSLLSLVKDTASEVKAILDQQNRTDDNDLPDQLQLFEGFYAVPH